MLRALVSEQVSLFTEMRIFLKTYRASLNTGLLITSEACVGYWNRLKHIAWPSS